MMVYDMQSYLSQIPPCATGDDIGILWLLLPHMANILNTGYIYILLIIPGRNKLFISDYYSSQV